MRAVIAALSIAVLLVATPSHASTDLPPAGRSLFDQLTIEKVGGRSVQRIPYPFEALLRALEQRVGTDALGRTGVPAVLIPLGRSLQRNASIDRPFDHPRVVAAVTGDPRSTRSAPAPLLKDRLFLGFQDEAGVIEVISYNETAGRFEFQVVKDYHPGREPQVFYANRTVCTACHHNAGPIFSRPSWDETNANPPVARALAARAQAFHGVRVARGVDVPNAIDDAVLRANRFALVQLLWRDGCARATDGADPAGCRSAALAAALKLRLSASGAVDLASERARVDLLAPLVRAWKTQWPAGLAEPDPNIANRDPFLGESQRIDSSQQRPWGADEITPAVDPLTLRAPLSAWHGDAQGVEQFVRALATLIAATDVDALDRWLQRWPGAVDRERVALECQSDVGVAPRNVRCSARDAARSVSLEAVLRLDAPRAGGSIARLQLGPLPLREVALAPGRIDGRDGERRARFAVASRGAFARLADGRALEALELAWTEAPGTIAYRGELVLRNDFSAVEPALAALADESRSGRSDVLGHLPFRRAAVAHALFTRLGIDSAPVCCEPAPEQPAPRVERETSAALTTVPAALRPFYRHCGSCHAAADASPPGFLYGEPGAVERFLARCAPRIDYRLAMWGQAPAQRSKVAMPPPSFASSWEHARPVEDVALMRSYVARLLTSSAVRSAGAQAYESLPACRVDVPVVSPRDRAPASATTQEGGR